MPLLYRTVCLMLQELSLCSKEDDIDAIARQWFAENVYDLCLSQDGLALLSCLLPAKRHDRTYGLSAKRIINLVTQAWGVGASRKEELERLIAKGIVDRGTGLMRVVLESGEQNSSLGPLMVVELDHVLDRVAACCDFSDANLRRKFSQPDRSTTSNELIRAFQRMTPLEVKWAVRLLQKDLRPAVIPEMTVLELTYPLLPNMLRIYNSLSAVFKQLDTPRRPNVESDTSLAEPQTGTMVGLPRFEKARSLRHAQNIMHGREASIERKYDGEYCQVHVWRQEGDQIEIKLFSKSGRDSTDDRRAIIPTIRQCLELDLPTSPMEQCCILVSELVVWNDGAQKIMPFYKIRRHIARAGRIIGCRGDSAPRADEHLMMVFHDLLLWDEHVTIYHTYEHRRQQLQQLLSPVPGLAVIGRHVLLDFAMKGSISRLACEMAYALSQRWEGLVLKAYQAPYITGDGQVAQYVKLKKDYIPGLGDSVDLLVVGGRSDPIMVECLKLRPGSWTTFFLACRDVGEDLGNGDASVRFRLVGQVTPPSISPANLHLLNMHGRLSQIPFSCDDRRIQIVSELKGTSLPSHLFRQPAVAEVVGAGFDRPPNAQYLTLRFPRLVKIHSDRSVRDIMGLAEYQSLAREIMHAGDAQSEYRSWLCQLDYDSDDDLDEVATSSKSSQSQEEVANVIGAKYPAGSVAGIKQGRDEDRSACLSSTKKPRTETE